MSKIRIFALAKELGLDSKELIEHCNAAGIKLKNSALASITPEQKDVVLEHMNRQQGGSAPAPAEEETLAPTREAALAERSGKVPTLSRPAQSRTAEEGGDTGDAATAVEVEEPPAEPEVEEAEPVAEQPAAETEAEPEEEPPPEAAEPAAESDEDEGETGEEDDEGTGKKALSPDESMAPGGGGRKIVEMKPRGTQDREIQRRRDRDEDKSKPRSRVARPSVAAPPSYKPPKAPKPKAEEQPAQKPTVRFNAGDMLEGESPLSRHLRKHAEDKDRRKSGRESLKREEGEDRRKDRRRRMREGAVEEPAERRQARVPRKPRRSKRSGPVEYETQATVEAPMTVRSLSEAMGRPAKQLMGVMFKSGKMATINEVIDEDTAYEIAMELGVELEIKRGRDIEEELVSLLEGEEDPETLQHRPPIVTILGHVDHGKTSMLDKLRQADVAAGEAGGITQHIASYQVDRDGQKVTFVDTPGHAAFGEMRARGANVTDIVVLVVAADDGVMPQTVECISHAKAAEVPIIVAMNKIDLPDVDQNRVLQDLSAHELLPAEWGGDTEVVRTSATTGEGLDELLEMILTVSELQEFQANPDRPAVGVCLEAFRDEGRGPIAWLVVQKGTLKVGDVVLCGTSHGRIRAIYDDLDREIAEAGPSTPVKIAGLDSVPEAGDHFFVMSDIEEARQVAEDREHEGRARVLSGRNKPRTLDDILAAARGGTTQDLPLIVKADTPGSLEALRSEIGKFEHPEVKTRIVHEGVGGVNESDVSLASASGAIIVAFHVIPEDRAQALAEKEGVDIRRFDIIYEVTETIKRQLEGMLEPERVKVPTGRVLVLQTFDISRYGRIAGCRVLNGTVERSNRVQVSRDRVVLNDYDIASLRREKDDVKEVREGMECGIRLQGFNDVKEGDIFDAYRIEERKRTLE